MTRLHADFLLLLVALIWGSTFVAQKAALAHMGPLLFIGLRFTLAAVLLAPLAWYESRRAAQPLARGDWVLGLLVGSCLLLGCAGQQIGLQWTSAGHAGFLTAVYMVLVPLVAWLVTRHRPAAGVLLAAPVALVGAWLLAGANSLGGAALNRGDVLILLTDLVWALHISLLARPGAFGARPFTLNFLQCALTGLVCLAFGLVRESVSLAAVQAALPALLYAGILSSGLAFTLQILAQRHTPPAEAALIMSLESVFSALAGAWWLGERMSGLELTGALLVMAAVLVVEALPLLDRRRAARKS